MYYLRKDNVKGNYQNSNMKPVQILPHPTSKYPINSLKIKENFLIY